MKNSQIDIAEVIEIIKRADEKGAFANIPKEYIADYIIGMILKHKMSSNDPTLSIPSADFIIDEKDPKKVKLWDALVLEHIVYIVVKKNKNNITLINENGIKTYMTESYIRDKIQGNLFSFIKKELLKERKNFSGICLFHPWDIIQNESNQEKYIVLSRDINNSFSIIDIYGKIYTYSIDQLSREFYVIGTLKDKLCFSIHPFLS